MEVKIPQLTTPIMFTRGECQGVYTAVNKHVYFSVYYTSIAASSVREFNLTTVPEKLSLRPAQNYYVELKKFNFGSLAVDEDLLAEYHSNPESQELLKSAIQITDLPELYINRSIRQQLEKALDGTPFTVHSQGTGVKDILPYNIYYNSHPDLVIKKENDTSVVASGIPTPPPTDDDDGDDDDETEDCVAELKKGDDQEGVARAQLYAEAFNVLTSSIADKVKAKQQVLDTLKVYCILLTDDGRKGLISRLIVDFRHRNCRVEEEDTKRESHECFNLIFNQ